MIADRRLLDGHEDIEHMDHEDISVITLARGSYLSIFTLVAGHVQGRVMHNSLVIHNEKFVATDKAIINEDDLYTYVSNQQKSIRQQAAAEHVYRKAQ